jgi:hypothetical protein
MALSTAAKPTVRPLWTRVRSFPFVLKAGPNLQDCQRVRLWDKQ